MTDARTLIRENLDYPALLDDIADHDDLIMAGVNSGEMVRIALACEQHLDREITDEELTQLKSVRAVAELLGQSGGT
ncbi:MAG TPA: phosphopantetheine-binding protein [Micromonosporaceae bacterium]|nr:phosphopantetheine-binding protein [Micromonosporaceae bacterium]